MKQIIISFCFLLFFFNPLKGQIRAGFNGGITYSKALNVAAESPYISGTGEYEHLALLNLNLNGFVNYQFNNWIVELQFGEKRLGYRVNLTQHFTPNSTTAPGYPHSGVHPVYHFDKYRYDYYNVNFRLKRMIVSDLQIFLGVNPLINRLKFTNRKNTIKIPNPDKVIRYKWRLYKLDDTQQFNLLLDFGLNYRIAKNFSLEFFYLIGVTPINIRTEYGKIYHNGISTVLVMDFGVRKPKFLSKK